MSIIVPVYNGEEYITRALNSLVNQTMGFENLEVILVNDGSTDSSLEILKGYTENYNNALLVNLDNNSGSPSYSRNIGIKNASSEYIMFMDQDDFYEPNACELLYNKTITYDADIVSAKYYKLRDDVKLKSSTFEKDIFVNNIHEYPELLGQSSFVWSKIFKKSLIMDNDILFPLDGAEDIVFTIECLLKAKNILFLKDAHIYTHFINSASISRTNNVKYFNNLLLGYENTYNVFKKNNSMDYFKYFIKMRLGYSFQVIVNAEEDETIKIDMIKKYRELVSFAQSKGTEIDDRTQLMIDLIDSNCFRSVLFFIRYVKVSKKRLLTRNIVKHRNNVLRDRNIVLRDRNIVLRDRNAALKDKNKELSIQLNNISSLKGYIKYKIKNIKDRFI
ncbi:glycosyltransferase family 2 protein [Methanobrevibacter filiformis]|uniref:glycosyltransferase family 2 protein n=1 Tax=Methanobrevibacter filiformis TaxID=55758 RepID=UPI001FE20D2A|nr:glycosyltransferase [Methanobrevibacter filiformis]